MYVWLYVIFIRNTFHFRYILIMLQTCKSNWLSSFKPSIFTSIEVQKTQVYFDYTGLSVYMFLAECVPGLYKGHGQAGVVSIL